MSRQCAEIDCFGEWLEDSLELPHLLLFFGVKCVGSD